MNTTEHLTKIKAKCLERIANMEREKPHLDPMFHRSLSQTIAGWRSTIETIESLDYIEDDAASRLAGVIIAAWLRELISAGLIPDGDVDERSITELQPDELRQYTQCHFFAGIGGWSYALQLAGWPADKPVWTGSCPCQPFSGAGKGLAQADERHLWPVFFDLIKECRPDTVFGEQVASAIGKGWLDGVSTDLESENYACGATVLGAHSVSAPHIRQRLYWVADSGGWQRIIFSADCDEDGNCPRCGIDYADCECLGPTQDGVEYEEFNGVLYGRMGDTVEQGLERQSRYGDNGNKSRRFIENATGSTAEASAASGLGFTNSDRCEQRNTASTSTRHRHSAQSASSWDDYQLAHCRDEKSRRIPTEPTFQPLANGIPARVVRLRGYGNAIVPQVAAEFVKAYSLTHTDNEA